MTLQFHLRVRMELAKVRVSECKCVCEREREYVRRGSDKLRNTRGQIGREMIR